MFFIMRLEYFFPNCSVDVLTEMSTPVLPFNGSIDFSITANQELDVLAPVDEITGTRPNILNKIVDEAVNPLEKQRLMASLQRIPSSSHGRMSDADLIATTPSRYNQTLTDSQKFSEHLVNVIESDKDTTSSDDVSTSSGSSESADTGTSSSDN